ncbi:RHS repeat-associated core domain-containing protein [Serratia sp. 2723]|uniref:RHS repeat-associated core domain-containing protein n=1 Tax=unclassified Serratia (in: enterobacteria) TaxID=2647522 RepID=UPI003D1A9C05
MGLQSLWEQHYRYQAQGELASITGNAPREYGYDTRGQLLNAQFPGSHTAVDRHSVAGESFLYDTAGNRVSEHGERDSAPGNRLAFYGDRHFEYDRFGNLAVERRGKAHKLVTTFAYDCRHRLIKRTDPHGRVTTYTYDAFNRRTSKTVEGQTTEFLWQGNKLIAETDNQQHWQTFLYEPGSHRPMATVVGSTRLNSPKVRTYWYQNDHLGTPHSLTDIQGNTVWRRQYSAYGQLTEEWTPPDDPYEHPQPKVNNPLRFQGQYEDVESGLYYNLNRYYDPGVGRYLTADPIKLAGGLNQYRYCINPINWIDPLGLANLPKSAGQQKLPQDLSQEQFKNLSLLAQQRSQELGLGDDIFVQGSRASHTARADSDIDLGIRVSPNVFDDFLLNQSKLGGTINPGTAKERSILYSIDQGIIKRGEARLSAVGEQITEDVLNGMKVDFSVIRAGSSFDSGYQIPLLKLTPKGEIK